MPARDVKMRVRVWLCTSHKLCLGTQGATFTATSGSLPLSLVFGGIQNLHRSSHSERPSVGIATSGRGVGMTRRPDLAVGAPATTATTGRIQPGSDFLTAPAAARQHPTCFEGTRRQALTLDGETVPGWGLQRIFLVQAV